MNTRILSRLQYPFPDLVNPNLRAMKSYAATVTDAYSDLSAPLREKIKAADPAGLVARFFPLAGRRHALTMVRYLLVAFAFEDTYTRLPFPALQAKCHRVAAMLEENRLRPDDEIVLQQFKLCLDEALQLNATPSWIQRFARHTLDFLWSLLTETTYYHNAEATRYPSIEECIRYRKDQTAVYPFIDYAELVMDFVLPDELYAHPYIQRLRELTAHFIVYVNDLYSVEKDLYNREIMNVALVIRQQAQCPLEEAEEQTLRLHNEDLAAFLSLCAHPPDLGIYNDVVDGYIRYLQLFIQGNLSWHKLSKRYSEYV